MVLEISKPTQQPSDSMDKEMIRTVLQGTYSRPKPGWTRVPWCIIKVMVAMFPNLALGPGAADITLTLCGTAVQGDS